MSLFLQQVFAQYQEDSTLTPTETQSISRAAKLGVGFTLLGAGALVGMNELWYKSFPRSKLHSFNDSREWLQIDKAGHLLSAYQINHGLHESFLWAGAEENNALVLSSVMSFGFLGGIELMDGFSEGWGFSWSDLGANSLGIGLYLAQHAIWREQRILPKFSYHPTAIANCRPSVLGSNQIERIFKDYNGQTYWLSLDLNSFSSKSPFPKWLSIAFGLGANGMIGANNNDVNDIDCHLTPIRSREFYFSLDLVGKNISSNKRWIKGMLKLSEYIKIPAPTLKFDTHSGWQFYPLYF